MGERIKDITAIYYTANQIPEKFAENIRNHLLSIIGGIIPIISVSQKPIGFGKNICVGDIGSSTFNVYRQIMIGCQAAETEYVAFCEDDCLYTFEYFTVYRGKGFGYNRNRWSLYTWKTPAVFAYKDRPVTSQCIAPRRMVIEAITERFDNNPNLEKVIQYFGELGKYDRELKMTPRGLDNFITPTPNIVFKHLYGLCGRGLGVREKIGINSIYRLPFWGTAEDVKGKYYHEGCADIGQSG